MGPLAVAAFALAVVGTGAIGCSSHRGCSPPAGGRCAGPRPIGSGQLVESRDGLTLSGRFLCGGRLGETETSSEVVVTYEASAVGAGAMSCANVPLSVTLTRALGNRTVLDGVTRRPITVSRS